MLCCPHQKVCTNSVASPSSRHSRPPRHAHHKLPMKESVMTASILHSTHPCNAAPRRRYLISSAIDQDPQSSCGRGCGLAKVRCGAALLDHTTALDFKISLHQVLRDTPLSLTAPLAIVSEKDVTATNAGLFHKHRNNSLQILNLLVGSSISHMRPQRCTFISMMCFGCNSGDDFPQRVLTLSFHSLHDVSAVEHDPQF